MKNNKALSTIFLVVFIDLMGFGLILPLLPYIAETFNANPFQIGLLSATYSFFQFISAPILGRLSDKYGRKKLLIISQLGSMLGFLLLGFANSLPLLFASRVIDGITGGNISIAQAYIADVTKKKDRARGMGMIGAAFGLGFMLGPAIGGTLSQINFSTPAYFAAGFALLTSVTTALFLKETIKPNLISKIKDNNFSFQTLRKSLAAHPLGLIIVSFFLLSLGFSGLQGTFAIWAERTFGLGPSNIGFIFTFIGFMSVITQTIILPRVIKAIGERKTLKRAIPITATGFLIIPFAQNIPTLLLGNFLLVVGNSLANPSIQAIASENVDKDSYGSTLGILQSSASLGRILGPTIGGYLFATHGKDTPYLISSLVLFTVFLLLYKYLEKDSWLIHTIRNRLR